MEIDGHYYLKFALALRVCCYDWARAHLIASADWAQDTNSTTVAGGWSPNNLRWHALGSDEARRRRRDELVRRVDRERDPNKRLVKLGQLLHFMEDWYTHAGFPENTGHGPQTFGGNDPDSMAYSRRNNVSIIRTSLEYLAWGCDPPLRSWQRTDLVDDIMEEIEDDGLIDDLMRQSRVDWKQGRTDGSLSPEGERIVRRNAARIGRYIRNHAGRKIPDDYDFRRRGIPRPLRIEYDEHGEPTFIQGIMRRTRRVSRAALRSELRFSEFGVDRKGEALVVRYVVGNVGSVATDPGGLRLTVADRRSPLLLHSELRPLPSIPPGEKHAGEIRVEGVAPLEVVVGLRAETETRNARYQGTFVPVPAVEGGAEGATPRSADPDLAWRRFLARHGARVGHVVRASAVGARYYEEIVRAISEQLRREGVPGEVRELGEEGLEALGDELGRRIGGLVADEIVRLFLGTEGETPYLARQPDVRIRRRRGDCFIVVRIFAYSTKGEANEYLKRVHVSLGDQRGLTEAGDTVEEPSWSGTTSGRRAYDYTDVWVPVSRTVCQLLSEGRLELTRLRVTVTEVIPASIGSDTESTASETYSIPGETLRGRLGECC